MPAKALTLFILLLIILQPNHRSYIAGSNLTTDYDSARYSYQYIKQEIWEQNISAKRHMTTLINDNSSRLGSLIAYRKQFDILGVARVWPKRYRDFLLEINLPVMGFQEDPKFIQRNEGPVDFNLTQLLDVDFDGMQKELEIAFPSHRIYKYSNNYKSFNRFEIIPKYVVESFEDKIIPKMRTLDLKQYIVLEKEPQFSETYRHADIVNNEEALNIITLREFSENRLELLVNNMYEKAFLFYSQNYYPGWKAWIDGISVPVYRADYTFQALPVAKGKHSVVLEFDPWLFKVSKWVTIMSFLACIILFVKTYNLKLSDYRD